MLVSIRARLVILAMPKCASTAIEQALAPVMDMVVSGHPRAKHTPFRKYDRFLRPYLETFADGPLEVICLFREPIEWLRSWWRYRARDEAAGQPASTRGCDFEAFVAAYAGGHREPAAVGSQSAFVSRQDGHIGVDRIFRYESIDRFTGYLEQRLDRPIALDRLNASPPRQDGRALSPAGQVLAAKALARDKAIHDSIQP